MKVYGWNVRLLWNSIVGDEGRVGCVRGDRVYVGGKGVEGYRFNKNY